MELRNRWFTRWLYGVDNGVEKGPHAWVVREDDAATKPTAYPDYPNPAAAPVRLHPRTGGGEIGALTIEAGKGEKPEKLVDDVAFTGAQLAMADASEHRLLYATPPLTEALHISGTPKVTIRLACNKKATNLTVWLVELPWKEKARINDDLITRGWADPQNDKSLTHSHPLEPGKSYDLSFDLQPDDQVIAAGRRIGLMIFASDRDFTLWPPAGTELTVDLDATSLELPVVGGPDAFARLTSPGK
jgi:X-Pro dipeptidyl-peptidase